MVESKEVIQEAARQLAGFTKEHQTSQLRLRCAEIIFVHGSQENRKHLTDEAEKLYTFSIKRGK